MYDQSAYSKKLRDPRWQKVRLEVLARDGWMCRKCRATHKPFNVHHTYYETDAEPWEYPVASLLALCEDCHKQETADLKTEERRLLLALKRFGFVSRDFQMVADSFESGLHTSVTKDEFCLIVSDVLWEDSFYRTVWGAWNDQLDDKRAEQPQ